MSINTYFKIFFLCQSFAESFVAGYKCIESRANEFGCDGAKSFFFLFFFCFFALFYFYHAFQSVCVCPTSDLIIIFSFNGFTSWYILCELNCIGEKSHIFPLVMDLGRKNNRRKERIKLSAGLRYPHDSSDKCERKLTLSVSTQVCGLCYIERECFAICLAQQQHRKEIMKTFLLI